VVAVGPDLRAVALDIPQDVLRLPLALVIRLQWALVAAALHLPELALLEEQVLVCKLLAVLHLL
jgi:hypothetical protein